MKEGGGWDGLINWRWESLLQLEIWPLVQQDKAATVGWAGDMDFPGAECKDENFFLERSVFITLYVSLRIQDNET